MKLIKKINNNYALAVDNNGALIIVEGKGIGFNSFPSTLHDLSKINRTYYNFDEKYLSVIETIPQETIEVANLIYLKLISMVDFEINENLTFTLADHINFAIERFLKGLEVQLPLYYDLKQNYPLEYEVAKYGLDLIHKKLNVKLSHDEISGIMLNIINSEVNKEKIYKTKVYSKRNDEITKIVEQTMNLKLDRDSFNYSRFITHMNYLYERIGNSEMLDSENTQMYDIISNQYIKTNSCVEKIAKYLKIKWNCPLNKEEKLYLILHINRLCNRELGL